MGTSQSQEWPAPATGRVVRYDLGVSRTLPRLRAMPFTQRRDPFNHPDWMFEITYEGFRASYGQDGECSLVSPRNTNTDRFKLCAVNRLAASKPTTQSLMATTL